MKNITVSDYLKHQKSPPKKSNLIGVVQQHMKKRGRE
jgi:hypothetical protein